MTHEEELISKGKYLSFILRHGREEYEQGLIDSHGWMSIDDLASMKGYTRELIEEIVNTNNKARYEYNEDKTKIRARQGHSIPVDVELKEVRPPDRLFHGTADKFLDNIFKEGLKPQSRLYVHLSYDKETALTVGRRHGKPVILSVDARRMYDDGVKFYISNNGVWLTEFVDKKYISIVPNE